MSTFLMVFTKLASKIKSKDINICWLLEWLILTLIYAIRLVDGTAGADSMNYRMAFEQGYKVSEELIFIWLNQLIRYFTDNYHYFFFIVYAIFVFGLLYFERFMFDKKERFTVLFLYFSMYITAFGVMRQWIAISIGMTAFVLCAKGKYKKAVLMSLIGVGFHKTVIVYVALIIAYIFFRNWVKRLNYRRLIIAAIIVNFLFFLMSEIFISFMANTEYKNYVSNSALVEYSWLGYIPAIFFLFITLFYSKDLRMSEGGTEGCELGLMFMWANLALMFVTVRLGMFRLFVIFFPIRVFMISKMRKVISKKFKLGNSSINGMKYIYDLVVLFDGILVMWRTIGNGALPYLIDWNIL